MVANLSKNDIICFRRKGTNTSSVAFYKKDYEELNPPSVPAPQCCPRQRLHYRRWTLLKENPGQNHQKSYLQVNINSLHSCLVSLTWKRFSVAATPGFSSPSMAEVSKQGLVTSTAMVKSPLADLIV